MKKRSILFLGAIIIVVMTMVALFTANVSAYPLCGNARHDCDNPSVCLCADCRTDERVQTDMVVQRRRNELTTIENPDCGSECQLNCKVPTGESWINRTFRCKLRKTATNEQLGIYTATLHIFNPKIINETPFSEDKMVTLRLVEGTLPPDGQNVTIEQIRWYISDDGGKTLNSTKMRTARRLIVSR